MTYLTAPAFIATIFFFAPNDVYGIVRRQSRPGKSKLQKAKGRDFNKVPEHKLGGAHLRAAFVNTLKGRQIQVYELVFVQKKSFREAGQILIEKHGFAGEFPEIAVENTMRIIRKKAKELGVELPSILQPRSNGDVALGELRGLIKLSLGKTMSKDRSSRLQFLSQNERNFLYLRYIELQPLEQISKRLETSMTNTATFISAIEKSLQMQAGGLDMWLGPKEPNQNLNELAGRRDFRVLPQSMYKGYSKRASFAESLKGRKAEVYELLYRRGLTVGEAAKALNEDTPAMKRAAKERNKKQEAKIAAGIMPLLSSSRGTNKRLIVSETARLIRKLARTHGIELPDKGEARRRGDLSFEEMIVELKKADKTLTAEQLDIISSSQKLRNVAYLKLVESASVENISKRLELSLPNAALSVKQVFGDQR